MRNFTYIDLMEDASSQAIAVRKKGFSDLVDFRSKFPLIDFIFDDFIKDLSLDLRHYFYTKDIRFSRTREKLVEEGLVSEFLRLASHASLLLEEKGTDTDNSVSMFITEVIDNFCLFGNGTKGYIGSVQGDSFYWFTNPVIRALNGINISRDLFRVGKISRLKAEVEKYRLLKNVGVEHEIVVSQDSLISNSLALVAYHVPLSLSDSIYSEGFEFLGYTNPNSPTITKYVDSCVQKVKGKNIQTDYVELTRLEYNGIHFDLKVCKSVEDRYSVVRIDLKRDMQGTMFGLYDMETGETFSPISPSLYKGGDIPLKRLVFDLCRLGACLAVDHTEGKSGMESHNFKR